MTTITEERETELLNEIEALEQENAVIRDQLYGIQDQLDQANDEHDELLDRYDALEDQLADTERKVEDLKELETVFDRAQAIVAAGYNGAEVVHFELLRFGVRLTIDVDMTPGESLALLPGASLTVSGASPRDFADLENGV